MRFHVLGIPVTIGYAPVPAPEDLGEEYQQVRCSSDEDDMDRTLEIETIMYEEYGLVFYRGMWMPYEDDEEDESHGNL